VNISLRQRIFLWYALAISLLIVGLVFAAQRIMVESLRTALDERLQERTDVVAKAVVTSPPQTKHEAYELVELLVEQRLPYVPAVLRITDSNRTVLATFGDIPDPIVPTCNRLREIIFALDFLRKLGQQSYSS